MKNRKLNRNTNHDYSADGWYFVTTVVKDRKNWFGEIVRNKIVLTECGQIVRNQWLWLHEQYKYLNLDEFIVMPNHFHGILNIDSVSTVGTGRDLSLRGIKIKSISELIGAFKTTSSKLIHKNGLMQFAWQRSFHDRIIREENEYMNIKNYIINNPVSWLEDQENR